MKHLAHSHFDVTPATDHVLRHETKSVLDGAGQNSGVFLARRFDGGPSGNNQNPVSGVLSELDQQDLQDFLREKNKNVEKGMYVAMAENYGAGPKEPVPSSPSLRASAQPRSSARAPKPPQ